MKHLIIAMVLALFGANVGLAFAAPEPLHVSRKSLGGPGTRAEASSKLPESPYPCCPPPPIGIEGPDCR
jgi:hypothetical protein